MATLEQRPTIEVEITFRLTEIEARALEALAGYGTDAFLKVFYEHMGRHYLQPHEAGLRSLFSSTGQLQPILDRASQARKVFVNGVEPRLRAVG